MKKIPIMISALVLFLSANSKEMYAAPTSPNMEAHDWQQVHVHTEERLIDKYRKKVRTIANHHYHDIHVYRTIQVFTYQCAIHGDYKTIVNVSKKREEEQPH